MPRNLRQRAGEFNTGGARADHHKGQPGATAFIIGFALGVLERQQNMAAYGEGVLQRF